MVERSECSGYGLEVDVWACGVVLYTVLVGFPPFWHRKQLMMIRQIMEGRYSFASQEWQHVTDSAKQLISCMLVVEPSERINIEDSLHHEFFTSSSRRSSISYSSLPHPDASQEPEESNASQRSVVLRKRFRLAILQVVFLVRLLNRKSGEPMDFKMAATNPYSMKNFRKVIDGAAFHVYGHWVKRGDGQNRAAMFELKPKVPKPVMEVNRGQE